MDTITITNCLSELSIIIKTENEIIVSKFDELIKYHLDKLKEFDLLLKNKNDASINHAIKSNSIDNYNNLIKGLNEFYFKIDDCNMWNSLNNESKDYFNDILLKLPEYYKTEKLFKKELLNSVGFLLKINITIHRLFFAVQKGVMKLLKKQTAQTNPIGKIYFKYLIKKLLVPTIINELNKQVKLLQNILINRYLELFQNTTINSYNSISIEASDAELVSFKKALKKDLDKFSAVVYSSFEKEYWISLAKMKLPAKVRISSNRKYSSAFKLLDKTQRNWNTTFYALSEDWRFREQIFRLNTQINSSLYEVKNIYIQRINKSLIPEVKNQLNYTNEILINLPKPDSTIEMVKQFLVKELYKLKKAKAENTTFFQAINAANDIPKLLTKLQADIKEHLNQLQQRVGIVNNPDYLDVIKNSDIYYFTPVDFIEFDCLPGFETKIKEQTLALELKLKNIINEFNDYDQIIDFYLDTAITLTKEPEVNEQRIVQVFREGLERLLIISNRISELLDNLIQKDLVVLTENVEELKNNIHTLDNNNNIVKIYSSLLKSKAIAKSASNRKKIADFAVNAYNKGLKGISSNFKLFEGSLNDLKKRLNLDSNTEPISADLSLYLAECEKRLDILPIIYQHLYANTPIREINLFISRKSEIEILNKAYNNWINGGYSATTIVGELGSGKSSLLHYYSEMMPSNYQITYFKLDEIYATEADFYKLISQIFNNATLISDKLIHDFINNSERKIILIDGLERLYLRTVGGFQCMNKLLTLIVSSNHKIFWVTTISLYTYQYLTKTIQYPEYFDFIIQLKSMTYDEIQELVLKRHRLSGFNLSFENPIGEIKEGKDEIFIQNQRKTQFFEHLIKNAQGNISMALIYWLQSIAWKADNHIIVNDVEIPDFSFLNSYSAQKYYLLLAIILHGKISVEDLAKVLKISDAKSLNLLTILKEDSVLIKSGTLYSLNGILYRQVIKQLINKNLIQ